ncbi:MAG: hypothetical protein ACRYFX_02795 [Janthinobacterium lividum]
MPVLIPASQNPPLRLRRLTITIFGPRRHGTRTQRQAQGTGKH